MLTFQVAGHTFNLWSNKCVKLTRDGHVCNADWNITRHATHEDVGQIGWAHYGKLTQDELQEIINRRNHDNERYVEATHQIAKP